MSANSFLKSTLIYGIGNISVLIINFVLVPFYTFYLNKSELGYYDIIVTSAAFILPFVTLQMEMAVLRWLLNESNVSTRTRVIENSLFALAIFLSFFSLVFFIVAFFVDIKNYLLIFCYFFLYFTYPFLKQIIRGLGRSKQYVLAEVVYTLLFLLFAILFVSILKQQVKGLILANIAALLMVILFIIFSNRLYIFFRKISFSWILTREMLLYSIPLVLNATSIWFMMFSIKYFIVYNLGYAGNGLYAVAFKFASILQIINTIFYLSWQEEAIRIYSNDKLHYRFNAILKGYANFLMSLLIVIISLQPFIVPLVIDKQYIGVIKFIPILLAGFVMMCFGSFYGIVYQCERKTKGISYSAILSSLVIIIVNYLSSSFYSLYVASLSFLGSFFIFFLYRLIDTKKYIKIQFPYLIFLSFAVFASFLYFMALSANIYIRIASVIISLILAFFLNLNNLSVIKSLIIKKQ